MSTLAAEHVDLTQIDAVLFDLDGVLVPTSILHRRGWRELFTDFLPTEQPYAEQDYFDHLDGRPRYDGVQAVLASRGIELPWGNPDDSPEMLSVCGLANRKNAIFDELLKMEGAEPYPETLAVLPCLLRDGKKLAVVSSSSNARRVLKYAGIAQAFMCVVGGDVAAKRHLAGKPAPDTFLFAARQLGVPPVRAAVIEDATYGVAAGRAGNFGLVVGVNRGAGAEALKTAGADVVIASLASLAIPQPAKDHE
jgi:alpha,alpha-trehalose phosphorylase